jgi:hypothetical protein
VATANGNDDIDRENPLTVATGGHDGSRAAACCRQVLDPGYCNAGR